MYELIIFLKVPKQSEDEGCFIFQHLSEMKNRYKEEKEMINQTLSRKKSRDAGC